MFYSFSQCSISFSTQQDYCNFCTGTINSTPVGHAPFSYSWSSGQVTQNLTNICSGIYSVTMADANSCTATGTVVISSNGFNVSTNETDATCNNCCDGTGSTIVSNGYPPYIYSWSCTSQTASSVTGLCAGNCSVQITDSLGCTVLTNLVVSEPVSIQKYNIEKIIQIFPNPFTTSSTVKINTMVETGWLIIYNAQGQKVKEVAFSQVKEIILNRESLLNGLYIIVVIQNNLIISHGKIIIQD